MRVALFTDTFLPKVDGIVAVICLLLDHLATRGVETMLFAPRTSGPIERYNQTPVVNAPSLPFPFYPDLYMGLPTLRTFRELRQFDPHVIHLIHPSVFGLFSYMVIKQMQVPTLVSYHIDYGRVAQHYKVGPFNASFIAPTINFITRQIMNRADYNLAPSRYIQQRVREIGVTAEVGLWRRGVDAEQFHPRYANDAMRHRLSDNNPEDIILLYVGRISSEKQLHQLKPVLENVPGTRLALVGDGPARAEIEATFAGTPTVFMGYLQGEALSAAYASADIFVFPSALESFGLVVVEAMAAGLPVVASQVGGVTDVVEEGRTGYTFAVNDIDALIDGVRKIASSRECIAEMGAAARAFAETQTWPAMMDEVIGHYARLSRIFSI